MDDGGSLGAVEVTVDSDGLPLSGYLARPPARPEGAASAERGLVLCHGFPREAPGGPTAGSTYPQLADRLAEEAGWVVLTFDFRGTGRSPGDFSLSGWLADIRSAVDHLMGLGVEGVWLAGFGSGGSLALCAAGEDERVHGVAAFAAPADFDAWARDPEAFLEECRRIGVVSSPGFPEWFDDWARELREIRPLALVGKVPPRPVLLVHGADDESVSVMDARALVDAADGQAELRVLSGAGHRLRHDPRAVAVLLGWLERQE
jgi:pimeloyl-ACP methyl ester carboxylesterase